MKAPKYGPTRLNFYTTPQGYRRAVYRGTIVAEHRVVMERSLGRALYPGETVHHKNGLRDDNRVENLELWTTAQPYGQRVEDRIEWALGFLEQYGYSLVKS